MLRAVFLVLFSVMIVGCGEERQTPRYEPKGEIIAKKTYIVGIHPYLNSKKMFKAYRPILDYLEARIEGVTFTLETSQTYARYNTKLYRGDFHFSLPNPFQTYNALSHNYTVIAKMKPDSVFHGIIVARKDAGLTRFEQLKGKAVSFPAPTALAATMMPLYYLHEHGIDVRHDIDKRYVGSQYSSILNAFSADTVAAATWPPPWETWVRENPEKAAKMEVVWETKPLINNGFVVRKDVDKSVASQVAEALVGLPRTEKGRALLADAGFDGFEFADDAAYGVVATFLEMYEHAIGVPE